ncbi:sensor histidine kinase [Chitinivorax sp. B]|uniref:sensor histidine kinase n=1 Tax=Chitinivorax sp. B TaxID=2502235 RepID=UPI0010F637FC|nr:sensor histidine kinase [Chitinivorax sp. B]
MIKPNSLRLHLLVWLFVPLLALLGLDAWFTYQRAMSAANVAFDRMLYSSARAISEGVRVQDGDIVVDIPYFALEMFEANAEGRVFYRVSEDNGRQLTGYQDLPRPAVANAEFYRPWYADVPYRDETIRLLSIRQPVYDLLTARNRIVWVQVGETPESRRELARDILIGAIQQEAILIVLALAIVLVATNRGLRPLRRLSRQVARREEGDLSPIDERELQTELKPLVEALNQYMARQSRMLTARRRFFVDAAHQLKTPLAVMQAQAELALREETIPTVHLQVRQLLTTLGHASHGVKQLLSLSRLEPDSGLVTKLQPVDLVMLAREVAMEWVPVARRWQVDLGFECDGEVIVSGQPGLLHELIGNLVDNAIRYAGSGKHVTVRVSATPQPCLAVVDDGPGVPATERENVFKRFYRVAGVSVEGSGLGLPIVNEIARLHDADVDLTDTPGGGLTVIIYFPVLS